MYHISDDKRSRQSSEMIEEGLCRLLEKINIEDISISSLCMHCGVGRVTFYRHFDCIDDVLRLSLDKTLEKQQQFLSLYCKADIKKDGMLAIQLQFWKENQPILKLILDNNRSYIFQERYADLIYKNLHNIKLNPKMQKYREYLVDMRISMIEAILKRWINNGCDIPPKELAQAIIYHLENSITLTELLNM